jgi:hypothetical protein
MSEIGVEEESEAMAARVLSEASKAPQDVDWTALRQAAHFLERAKLSEWVAIMNDPRRNFWVNFLAGVARGVGMVVGATLVGLIFALFSVSLLKKAFLHAGGVPWVGTEMKEAIGFILQTVRERQGPP